MEKILKITFIINEGLLSIWFLLLFLSQNALIDKLAALLYVKFFSL